MFWTKLANYPGKFDQKEAPSFTDHLSPHITVQFIELGKLFNFTNEFFSINLYNYYYCCNMSNSSFFTAILTNKLSHALVICVK